MKHESYLELMSAALDGELTAEERLALDEHLAQCPDCAALFQELSGQSAALRSLDCEPPQDLHASILAGLSGRSTARRPNPFKRWAALAACLALVAVAALTARSFLPAGPEAPGTDGAALSGNAAASDTVSQEPEVPATPRPTPAARSTPPVTVSDAPQDPGDMAGSPEPVPSNVPDSPPVASTAPEPSQAALDEPVANEPTQSVAPVPAPSPEPTPEPVEKIEETVPAEKIVPDDEHTYGGTIGDSLITLPGIMPIGGGSSALTGAAHSFSNEQSFRVSWSSSVTSSARILGSVDSLSGFLTTYSLAGEPSLAYDEAFFQEHRLLAVVVTAGSGSIRFHLDPQGLTDTEVNLLADIPEIGTDDMAAWVILAEVDDSFEDGQVLTVLSGGQTPSVPSDPNAPVAY